MDNSTSALHKQGALAAVIPTFKTSRPIASTFLLQGTMTKQEIVAWLNDMKKEDPKTYQLLLLTILEQIQKDLGK